MKQVDKIFVKYSEWSLIFLRLGVGFIFLMHGVGKLFAIGPFAMGVDSVAGFFGSTGVPIPMFFAWIVSLVETFGGLAILLGFWTRLSALLLSITMTVALLLVHIPNGFYKTNGELPLLLLLGALTLLFAGAGKKLSIEK